jgi:hypothetical protein
MIFERRVLSRFTEGQIMSVLKQLEAGVTVADWSREQSVRA